MKYLEMYQLLNLDNNKQYTVTNSVVYDDNNYVLLVNPKDIKDQLVALVTKENNDLEINPIDLKDESNKEILLLLTKLFVNSFDEKRGIINE